MSLRPIKRGRAHQRVLSEHLRRAGAGRIGAALVRLGALGSMAAGTAAGATAPDPFMAGNFGVYPMSRESSGTSWQPDSAPLDGLMDMSSQGMRMWQGSLEAVYTDQGGARGGSQLFPEGLLMYMADHREGPDTLGLRLMGSVEPVMGAHGYPLLFQTGETADGHTPLVDRQHPHNLLLETAGSWSRTLGAQGSVFIYAGPVGEPALGPPAYMHRFSSEWNPEAPLTHHWLDSTHVSFGVATAGVVYGPVKLEGSWFNGREPDEHRYSVQFRRFDSSSWRLSYNPSEHWALQVSSGRLASPEQLEPQVAVRRTTASVIYDRTVSAVHWQSVVAFGRNAPASGTATDGWLFDTAVALPRGFTLLARYEHVVKDELIAAGQPFFGRAFLIEKASGGAAYDLGEWRHLRLSLGAVLSVYRFDASLRPLYGSSPVSASFFVRAMLAP